MIAVNVHAAKTTLSRLLQRAEAGEEVIIARNGDPVVKLVPVERPARRLFGADQGAFEVPEDFDAPFPEALIAESEP